MDTPHPNRRRRLSIGAGVVLVLLALAIAVLVTALGPRGSTNTLTAHNPTALAAEGSPTPGSGPATSPASAPSAGPDGGSSARGGVSAGDGDESSPELFVHVIGAVNSPGLYRLHDGDRAVDAVAAAGGLTTDADQAQVNLARFVSDGEQLIVPRVGEAPPPASDPAAGGAGSGGPGGSVNINTADASGLEELPGVGPALAERIVQWRDANGSFAAVEDLLNVTGIGQKKLDGMRDSIAL